jgi:hypothetical protein
MAAVHGGAPPVAVVVVGVEGVVVVADCVPVVEVPGPDDVPVDPETPPVSVTIVVFEPQAASADAAIRAAARDVVPRRVMRVLFGQCMLRSS